MSAGALTLEDADGVRQLHKQLLDEWNAQSASGMAALFEDDANVVGFDGSQMKGRRQSNRRWVGSSRIIRLPRMSLWSRKFAS